MKPSRLPVAIYLFVVFLSGIVVGVVAHRFYTLQGVSASKSPTTSEEWRKQYVEEMRTRLNLNSDQLGQLNQILDTTRSKYHALREKFRPELKVIQQQQVEQVRAILDERQRAEYEKLRQELDQRRKQHGHSH